MINQICASQPKILIVDDKDKNLFSLNAVLKPLDAEIHLAKSGKEAVSKALRNEYALILMDVQMPELDGFDTAKIIKANDNSCNVPIIFVTAFSVTDQNIQTGYDSGGIDYICKPINPNTLEHKIKIFLKLYEDKKVITKANGALKKANDDLLEFARIASHDLKEPLRGISNYVQFLKNSLSETLNSEEQTKLDRVSKLTKNMHNLINELFNYTQIGSTQEEQSQIDINQLANDVIESLQNLIEEKKASITIQPKIPQIRGNSPRIRELLHNLITNALKYNDSPKPIIEIGYNKNDLDQIVYFIRDNGIGIHEKHQDKIFLIFKRLHSKDKYGGGTGAGLSIVKKIIDMHKGKIWVESKKNKGSTFFFTIDDEL